MADDEGPTNAALLPALQGMWRQQKDLITDIETRLGAKLDGVAKGLEGSLRETEARLDAKIAATEARLTERLAQEIQDRPVVVHIDMSRVGELEKQVADLARRLAVLETREGQH